MGLDRVDGVLRLRCRRSRASSLRRLQAEGLELVLDLLDVAPDVVVLVDVEGLRLRLGGSPRAAAPWSRSSAGLSWALGRGLGLRGLPVAVGRVVGAGRLLVAAGERARSGRRSRRARPGRAGSRATGRGACAARRSAAPGWRRPGAGARRSSPGSAGSAAAGAIATVAGSRSAAAKRRRVGEPVGRVLRHRPAYDARRGRSGRSAAAAGPARAGGRARSRPASRRRTAGGRRQALEGHDPERVDVGGGGGGAALRLLGGEVLRASP